MILGHVPNLSANGSSPEPDNENVVPLVHLHSEMGNISKEKPGTVN